MKKTALLLAALAVGVSAQAQDAKRSYSVTSDFTYASKYVFRGVEQNDSDAFQPSIEVTFGDAYIGLWTNQPITRQAKNELDLYVGYKHKVNDALSIEAVGTYYLYPEAKSSLGETKDSTEVGVGATYTLSGISTSLYYYYDFTFESNTVQASVGYSIPLEMAGASVDLSAFFGSSLAKDAAPDAVGAAIKESYNYYGLDVSIPYKLSETATVTVGAHWSQNDNYYSQDTNDETWVTAGLTIGF